ncbi:hypothetical protein Bbelb_084870 [Branchiostoma belcheri]|nr:hypothetical protein Bbelb_084870 [Branchiostoma belcheri]
MDKETYNVYEDPDNNVHQYANKDDIDEELRQTNRTKAADISNVTSRRTYRPGPWVTAVMIAFVIGAGVGLVTYYTTVQETDPFSHTRPPFRRGTSSRPVSTVPVTSNDSTMKNKNDTISHLLGLPVTAWTTIHDLTTTLPKVTTTLPEVTTTLPMVTTTLPEVTTTLSGVTTTFLNATTSPPEVTTTHITATSTTLSEVTTTLPKVTTTLPEVTTTLPKVTTTLPKVTTTLPEVTTTLPKVTTTLPEVTTTLPEVTTTLSEVTTPLREETTTLPEVTTTLPEVTTTPFEVQKTTKSHRLTIEEVLLPEAGVNVALGKTAVQSSICSSTHGCHGNIPVDASRAVDGNTASDYHDGSCTHTTEEDNPSWWVDLGQPYAIGRVTIFNRMDCCPERLNPFNIHIGDSDQVRENPRCGDDHQLYVKWPSISVSCQGMKGRYVGVRLPGCRRVLSLCEVQVFSVAWNIRKGGCQDGYIRVEWACIKLVSSRKSFLDAQQACKEEGAGLAMPKTEEFDHALRRHVKTSGGNFEHWIGMLVKFTSRTSKIYEWIGGLPVGNYQFGRSCNPDVTHDDDFILFFRDGTQVNRLAENRHGGISAFSTGTQDGPLTRCGTTLDAKTESGTSANRPFPKTRFTNWLATVGVDVN